MKKSILIIVTALLCFFCKVNAQEFKSLKIGDKLPEELWNYKFKAIEKKSRQKTLQLSNYRGKPIIIDFWATWCTSCIKEMPKLRNLQNRYENKFKIISYTEEDEQKVEKFIQSNQIAKQNLSVSIVGDTLLSRVIFQHRVLPHYVWINTEGTVIATSTSDAITSESIEKIIDEKPLSLMNKVDIDPKVPLFMHSELLGNEQLQYSILLKGNYTGLSSGNQYRSVNGIIRGRALINTKLITIYRIIARELFKQLELPFTPDKLVSEISNVNQEQIYTYELTLPIDSARRLYQTMLADLNCKLPFEGKFEQREKATVFVITDKQKPQ